MANLHKQFITEMIERDYNHPSTFAWSVSNEPRTEAKNAREYFKAVVQHAKKLDPTRPATIVFGPTYSHRDLSRCVSRK